jgi:ribonuclease J
VNSKTSIAFYGGVNEKGGNKILLQDKDTRVFLDFGKGFSRRAKFFGSRKDHTKEKMNLSHER